MDWLKIDAKLKKFEDKLSIPDGILTGINSVDLKVFEDLSKIPQSGGCYWIWTNAPIKHSFHNSKFPNRFNNGEIIYNGIAKDDIRGRIQKHLFGIVTEGMSAISIDILQDNYTGSHRKKALAATGNTAFFENSRIRTKDALLKLYLTNEEINFINGPNSTFHFRNGINILENKHKVYDYRIYYLSGFKSASYGDIIEKKWREQHGLPRLCTYKKGR